MSIAFCSCMSVAQTQVIIDAGETVTVPSSQTNPWDISSTLTVNGTLNIRAGGIVSNTSGYIGYNSGESGTVTVDGSDSTWTNSSTLYVGRDGTGALTIRDGGTVSNTFGYIGYNSGGSGAVTVDGSDSTWTNSDSLTVGRNGTGLLTISDGGTVSNSAGTIGSGLGGSGTVSVDGSGSTWTNSSTLSVGVSGTGTLTIRDGGTVSNSAGYIGYNSGSLGAVTVDGSGSTWVNSSGLYVGRAGTGVLTISDGGTVSSTTGFIGSNQDGSGTVTVTGRGSAWTNSSALTVGSIGTGILTISDGGAVSNSTGNIGYNSDSLGTITVDGSGSTWTNSGSLTVGYDGTGTLHITDNAVVSATNGLMVAFGSAATGTLDVTSGSTLETLSLSAGSGTIAVAFNDGTLRALTDNDAFITGFAASEFNIAAGGLTIDDSGYSIATDSSVLSGVGLLTKTGSGTLTLNGINTYTGATTVSSGTLKAGIADTFSAASAFTVNNAGTLDLNGYDQSITALSNSGIVRISSAGLANPVGATLTVTGNYTSNNGTLVLNTVLGDDTSTTDKLIIKGDTAGHTNVVITNIGGSGAQTINGIEIVEVDGSSGGIFGNSQRIVAGAYDYFVRSGSTISGAEAKNWYLISDYSPTDPTDPSSPVYRPEVGSYLANLAAANTMFITRLHDRLGETQYTDVFTGEKKVTSLWMRHIGGHTRFKESAGQLSTQSNRYVLQLGSDITQWSSYGLDRWHLGLMAGYANSKSRTHSSLTGYSSRGEISGYSAGVYNTWYANEQDKTGMYVDSWLLYNWFDNKVSGQGLTTEKYDSDGITATVEAGYTFNLGESSDGRNSYWLQPKAQVIWMDVHANSHTEKNGTRVTDKTDGNLQTRLGMKAYLQGHNKIDDGKNRTFQPFVEANWIYNSSNYSVKMDDVRSEIKGTRNIGELKVGVEGQINKCLQLWGNVAQQLGDTDYSDTQGMIGVKYIF
uniref:autotransporter outer membrane beta-barrel domain-containing protein n=1 Tax=Yersinia frederiksenii TaxID=29484 RepID=UPI001F4C0146|nr:autotransporter outer membrane beta-barrel domain-containing protein [Yersinia frederiksenii]